MIKKYEKYKPSGVEWIGEIPEHWEIKKLKYRDDAIMGQSPSSDDYNYVGIGLPFIQGNAEFKKLHPEPKLWCETANKVAIADDILLSVRAPIGAVNIADQKIGIGRGLCAIRANQDIYKFLYYHFLILNEELNSIGTGSTYTAISAEEVKNVLLITPPTYEQTAIANFLDEKTAQIDTLIEKKKKLIDLLKEERTAIINYAVTKGINPDAKLKPSGIDWLGDPSTKLRASIPEHWELKKLKYVTEINSTSLTEKEDDDLEIEYIDISSVNEYGEIMQTASYFYSDAPSRARRIIHKGDTIISTVRTYLKAIAFIDVEKNNLICSTGFAVIRPSEKLEPNFLFYLSRSEKMVDRIMALSKGVSYPAIDSEDIKNLVGWFPDKDEQETIVQHIETRTARIDAAVSKIEKEIELLQEYRTALVSEVVTGKICVI